MIPFLTQILDEPAAIEALRRALRAGLDPEAGTARARVPVEHGHLLLMPAEWGGYAGVKVASVSPGNPALGLPRIQGVYLLLDSETLRPLAMIDGAALTAVRTAAVSALAVDALAVPEASRMVVFGTGPQGRSHVAAIRAVRPVEHISVIGRDPDRTRAFASAVHAHIGTVADIASADVIVCATTARTPLFDGALLPPHATVVAVGSHERDAREVDDTTVRSSTVVVEARAALPEAGDVVALVETGVVDENALVDLASLVRGTATIDPGRPRLFKSVGMAWEDLVIAADSWERHRHE